MKFAHRAPLLLTLGACLTLCSALSSCGGGSSAPAATATSPTPTAGVENIAAIGDVKVTVQDGFTCQRLFHSSFLSDFVFAAKKTHPLFLLPFSRPPSHPTHPPKKT